MQARWLIIIVSLLILLGIGARAEQKATITLDISKEKGKVNRLIFGNNQLGYQYEAWKTKSEYAYKGAGIWDPDTGQPVPEMVKFAKDIGMSVARWPGGCGSHNFNWKKTIGPVSERQNQKFGLPEFLRFCSNINAIPIITVAEYWGTAQDGADLVEYLNSPDDGKYPWAQKRTADGHKEPWNVLWFEYGNESDHGNHGGAQFSGPALKYSPQEYAKRYLEYREAMKSVDNRIKLGVVVTPGVWQILPEWDKGVLKAIGPNLDFAIPHTYIPGYYRNDGIPDSNTLFSIGLAGPSQVSLYLQKLNELISQNTGRKDVPLANTEFNGHFVQEKPVPYRLCLGTALVVADFLRVFMQPESNIIIANYWQFANEYWGMVKGYQPPYTLRPAYWVFWLYAHYFGDILIDAQVKCGSYDTDGGYSVMSAKGKPTKFTLFPENLLPEQGWVLSKIGGVEQSEEDGMLVAEIQTEENLNYYHASKQMPAEPSTGYRLTAEIKTEGLEKSKGAQIQIGDARGWTVTKSANLTSEVKSLEWKEAKVDYITLPDAAGIVIQARRLEGVGNKGKIHIRNVKVQKFIPDNPGSTPYLSVNASKSADNRKVFVAIVNKHLSQAIETQINGIKPAKAKAWCLMGPSVDATNEQNPNNVCVVELPASTTADAIKVLLPQHSMTVVEIEKK